MAASSLPLRGPSSPPAHMAEVKACAGVICCNADHSALPCIDSCHDCTLSAPASPCSDAHHISSSCTEPTCGAASSSTNPGLCTSAIACCDDTACEDLATSPCSDGACSAPECSSANIAVPTIATCCQDEACEPISSPRLVAKPKPSTRERLVPPELDASAHVKAHARHSDKECQECRGSLSVSDSAEGGRMYGSFQELLDCCCCSMHPLWTNAVHAVDRHHTRCAIHLTCAQSLFALVDSLVSGYSAAAHRVSGVGVPVADGLRRRNAQRQAQASHAIRGQAPTLDDILTELQSWNDCLFEQPHMHSSGGGCLPPAMTLCSSNVCPTAAPHSHRAPHHARGGFEGENGHHDPRPQMCQWAGCNERFWTVEELVAHVNHSHLAPKNTQAAESPNTVMQHAQQIGTIDAGKHAGASVECLWDDCHQVPTPMAGKLQDALVPATAGGDLWNNGAADKFSLAILQHLLHDHLGQHVHHPSHAEGVLPEPAKEEAGGVQVKKRKASTSSGSAVVRMSMDRLPTARHKFTQKQKVLRHLQTHTGDRPFKCTICGKRFSEQNTLAQHVRTHTLERPYVCDHPGCGKAFSVAGSLTIHKRTHTGSKPFVCSFPGCGKAFAESSNLTKHMRTHTGVKPFRCEECGKCFSRPDQASRHRKTHERKRRKQDPPAQVHDELLV
ncbi:related to ZAP1 - metalloregulatory protein involved in zinc-responsive transcriptional regulation [Moesziomyces antarcticus]|uniref:Related to ZAP1 - metalloregulatory protein involved in zinc-responsive transcriptional regulation n=1 Tax=Pseudozyma antarctica TaxID=84753 RepID=A0A5C3G0N5_PSEA2|nr:related to ZAP1 - metalloregulatory protein involved in zinc-responsive transcriptional regulation [Moesziomyces antarcticus]